jgi:hypothetical protein
MDTSPRWRNLGRSNDKRVILEMYDEMKKAMETGIPYKTRLDLPPGPPTNPDGSFKELPKWESGQPKPKDWPEHIHAPREVDSE